MNEEEKKVFFMALRQILVNQVALLSYEKVLQSQDSDSLIKELCEFIRETE